MSDEPIAQKSEEKGTRLLRWVRAQISRRVAFTYLDWLASFASFLLPFLIVLLGYTGYSLYFLALSGFPEEAEDLRWHALAFAGLVAILGGLVGAPLALIRVYVAERTAKTAEEQRQIAQEQRHIAEQGHITDRITKAVEQLGAEKTVKVLEDGKTAERTEPNLEVRLGAIYALERIAQDSERDHIPIMETLCAYVRENSNARAPRNLNLAEWEPPMDDADEEERERYTAEITARFSRVGHARAWVRSLPSLRADVQAAVTVIGRRSALRRSFETARGYFLDLHGANLQRADFSGLCFERSNLMNGRFEGADFSNADLTESRFTGARLEGTWFRNTRMPGADLSSANFEGASFYNADLQEAYLDWSRINGSSIENTNATAAFFNRVIMHFSDAHGSDFSHTQFRFASLNSVDLREAIIGDSDYTHASLVEVKFMGAMLSRTRFSEADIRRCNFRNSNLAQAREMTQDQVNSLFGDHSIVLPEGLRRTDLMDREPLENPWDPDPDYEAWLAAGAPPGKPIP